MRANPPADKRPEGLTKHEDQAWRATAAPQFGPYRALDIRGPPHVRAGFLNRTRCLRSVLDLGVHPVDLSNRCVACINVEQDPTL